MTRVPRRRRVTLLILFGVTAFLRPRLSSADQWIWTGFGTTDHTSWSHGDNWLTQSNSHNPPSNDGTTDIAFAAFSTAGPNLDANWSIRSLTFTGIQPNNSIGTNNGSKLTIGSGGVLANNTSLPGVTINVPVSLASPQTWMATSDAILNVENTVNINAQKLTLDGEGDMHFDNSITGPGDITLNGRGTVTFGGAAANTNGGILQVNAGLLTLSKPAGTTAISSLLSIGNPIFNQGSDVGNDYATVELSSSNQIDDFSIVTVNRHGALNLGDFQDTIGGLIFNGGSVTTGTAANQFLGLAANYGTVESDPSSSTATINGALNLNDDSIHSTMFNVGAGATISGNDLEVSGVISNGAITKTGSGTLWLGGANTFAGGVSLQAGKIIAADNSALGIGTFTMNSQTTLQAAGATTLANPINIPAFGSNAIIDGPSSLTLTGLLTGSGGLIKNGTGTLTFSNAPNRSISGGFTINAGTVAVGPTGAGDLAIGGNLTVGTASGQSATLNINGGSLTQNNFTSVAIGATGSGAARLNIGTAGNGTLTIGSNGLVIYPTGLVTMGNGSYTGTLNAFGPVTVNGGTLTINSGSYNTLFPATPMPLRILNGGTLNTSVSINGPILGDGDTATINVNGDLTFGSLGDTLIGFNHQGTLNVFNHTLTLQSLTYAQLGVLTTINQGTIVADNGQGPGSGGISLGSGSVLYGRGIVNGLVTGAPGSKIVTIQNDTLELGNSTSLAGFNYGGELDVGLAHVVLDSSGPATLGNLTVLNGGVGTRLTANNGLVLNFGSGITGSGPIDTGNTLAQASFINGTVQGTSPSQMIVLSGWIKGTGTFTNVMFNGTHDPGFSPTLLNVGNVTYGPAALLDIELAGTTRGSQYDAIASTGALTLGGTLHVSVTSGFTPIAGNSFDILDWGNLNGAFASLQLPLLAGGLTWNASQFYTTGTLSVGGVLGDYNHNGVVDQADYVLWRDTLSQSGAGLAADGNGNGVIDQPDYDVWRAHFGQTAPGGAPAVAPLAASALPIPEPSAATLLLLASLARCSGSRCQRAAKNRC